MSSLASMHFECLIDWLENIPQYFIETLLAWFKGMSYWSLKYVFVQWRSTVNKKLHKRVSVWNVTKVSMRKTHWIVHHVALRCCNTETILLASDLMKFHIIMKIFHWKQFNRSKKNREISLHFCSDNKSYYK